MVQTLPLGKGLVEALSPRAEALLESTRIDPAAQSAEAALLGTDPTSLDAPATLSVDRHATASSLRTGAALAGLFVVATTVAATAGLRRVAFGLLASAGFQGLYGLLVLVSGSARIWNVPKTYYLDCATGTFVNRNHFACFLAMGLAVGLAAILAELRGAPSGATGRRRWVEFWGSAGSRSLLLGIPWILGLAGLFTSFSRAGTALALGAVGITALAAGRSGIRARVVAVLLAASVAVVPLAQIGAERLFARYGRSAEAFTSAGGRGTVWRDTLEIAAAFPLTGAGFGSFVAVYPAFRSPDVRLFYAHAHNDLIQAAAEGGLLGLVLLACLILAAGRNVVRAVTGSMGPLAVGVGAALGATLLHGLIDFNFHIPANAAIAAILAGGLEGLAWTGRD